MMLPLLGLDVYPKDTWAIYSSSKAWLFLTLGHMQYVLIIHEVEDYLAWKKVFDGAAGIRYEAGERTYQVLKYENEPNKIVHFSAWTSIADAKAFFESPRLVQIRAEAGVKAPDFIYLDQLEAGVLGI
jgi:quinol monooxygenase YgiN